MNGFIVIRISLVLIALLSASATAKADRIVSFTTGDGLMSVQAEIETLAFTVTLAATSRIPSSNLFFAIIAPGGAVVRTHSADVPRMNNGDVYFYTWVTDTAGFPEVGDYTAIVCWSRGNAQNCGLGYAELTFFAANSLGVLLPVFLALIGGGSLWHYRRQSA